MKTCKKQFNFIIALLSIVIITVPSFSQENELKEDKPTPKNELKLNAIYLLANLLEVNYEYIINSSSAFGLSAMHSLSKEKSWWQYSLTPYYRAYFGKKEAQGFFLEGNVSLYSEEIYYDVWYFFDRPPLEFEMGLGLGLAVGGKFLNKKGLVGELYIGVGRNFINTDVIEEYFPRVGISIGKRF